MMRNVNDGAITYWYLAGIVSYGSKKCGVENFPAVYTKVSAYMDWILKNVEQ
jgi:secreted trypsin-like serine protease